MEYIYYIITNKTQFWQTIKITDNMYTQTRSTFFDWLLIVLNGGMRY